MWQLEQTPCHKKIAVVSYSTFSTVPFLRAGSRLWKGMVGSHPPFHRKIFRSISTNNDRRYSCACHPIPTNKKIFRLPCNNKRWSSLSPLLPWLNSSIPSIRLRSWVPNPKCARSFLSGSRPGPCGCCLEQGRRRYEPGLFDTPSAWPTTCERRYYSRHSKCIELLSARLFDVLLVDSHDDCCRKRHAI